MSEEILAKLTKPGTPSKRAWGYIRVSSRQQANSGHSLGEQESAIKEYCARMGYELAGIFTDPGVSASVPLRRRPNGLRLCCSIQKGDTIVVKSLCRLFRNFRDALHTMETWRQIDGGYLAGINLRGMTFENSSAIGSFVFNLLTLLGQLERELASERTRDVVDGLDRQGVSQTCKPGFYWGIRAGKFVQLEHEPTMEQVKQIVAMYEAGMPFEKIYTQVQLAAKRKEGFIRMVSKRRKRRYGDPEYDPKRQDIWGRWIVENNRQPWGLTAIKNVIKDHLQAKDDASLQDDPESPPPEPGDEVDGGHSDDPVVKVGEASV